ncbi:MAG: hypothetical protein N2652_05020 [Kiritimatiellae bacterium]|nr:hypothetical protein [Kiritimatiellia bacterium]
MMRSRWWLAVVVVGVLSGSAYAGGVVVRLRIGSEWRGHPPPAVMAPWCAEVPVRPVIVIPGWVLVPGRVAAGDRFCGRPPVWVVYPPCAPPAFSRPLPPFPFCGPRR